MIVPEPNSSPNNNADSLRTQEGVIALMESSTSKAVWNDNADAVKAANDGDYPSFWFEEIIMSGLVDTVTASFEEDA